MTPNNDNQNITLSPPQSVPTPSKAPVPTPSSIPIVPSGIPQEVAIQPISPTAESPAMFTPTDIIPIPIPSLFQSPTKPCSDPDSPAPAEPLQLQSQLQPQLEPNQQQEVQEPNQLQSEEIKDSNPQNSENITNIDTSHINQDTTNQVDTGNVNCDLIDQPQSSHQDHSSN